MAAASRDGLPHGSAPQGSADPVDGAAPPATASRLGQWSVAATAVAVTYVFSSGPVLAGACWLREATGWDGFYAAFLLYLPLSRLLRLGPMDAYIERWFWLFGTVGPG